MTKIGSYKGCATISLAAESKWPFTFGVAKAKLILQELEAIRAFVAANEARVESRFDRDNEDRAAERIGV